jgi:predicted RNase H-like HicB family nuclease
MSNLNKDDLFGYSVRLYKLGDEYGGGWGAEVSELKGCFSDGETPEEAINNLKDAILGWIEIAKEDGKTIPPPNIHSEEEYSGKFTVRVPKSIHKLLVEKAEQEGVSLNSYINTVLSYNMGLMQNTHSAAKEETNNLFCIKL